MDLALELAKWLTQRWWTAPLGWLIYGLAGLIGVLALLACALIVLSIVGGVLYGIVWSVATSNPTSGVLFVSAALLAVLATGLWWSVDHEAKGFAVGVLAAVVGVAWIVSIPGEKPKPGTRAAFCEKHECVGDWKNADGYRVRCADGTFSFSGGMQGSCSGHGGNRGNRYFGAD